mgnify:CR=1 FL=1
MHAARSTCRDDVRVCSHDALMPRPQRQLHWEPLPASCSHARLPPSPSPPPLVPPLPSPFPSSDHETLLVGTSTGHLQLHSPATGALLLRQRLHHSAVASAAVRWAGAGGDPDDQSGKPVELHAHQAVADAALPSAAAAPLPALMRLCAREVCCAGVSVAVWRTVWRSCLSPAPASCCLRRASAQARAPSHSWQLLVPFCLQSGSP